MEASPLLFPVWLSSGWQPWVLNTAQLSVEHLGGSKTARWVRSAVAVAGVAAGGEGKLAKVGADEEASEIGP